MIMSNIPVHLLNSKLITDSEWEEYVNLKHRNNILEERYNEVLGILSEDDSANVRMDLETLRNFKKFLVHVEKGLEISEDKSFE